MGFFCLGKQTEVCFVEKWVSRQIIGGTCVFITSKSLSFFFFLFSSLLALIVWCRGSTLLYCLVSSAGGLSRKQLSKGNLLHSPFQKHSFSLHEPVSLSKMVFLTAPAQALFSDSPPQSRTHTQEASMLLPSVELSHC